MSNEIGDSQFDEAHNENIPERRDANIRTSADIAYDIGTILREKMDDLIYNEAFYGIMYQLVNCVILYGNNVHHFDPQIKEIYEMVNWVLQDMYEKNIFMQMQAHMKDRYDTEQMLNTLWETPKTKHDDNI